MKVIDNLERSVRTILEANNRLNSELIRNRGENERLRNELHNSRQAIERLRSEIEKKHDASGSMKDYQHKKRNIEEKIHHIIKHLDTIYHIDTDMSTNED